MSRLSSLSPAAIKAMFSTDSDDTLSALITLSGSNIEPNSPIRLCENYTHRFEYLTSTQITAKNIATGDTTVVTYGTTDNLIKDAINSDPDEVFYGILGPDNYLFLFLPFTLSLPSEEEANVPKCEITLNDVGRQLIPSIRSLTSSPNVLLQLVLTSNTQYVEIEIGDFLMDNVTYNASSITGTLVVESLAIEPFPAHQFVPSSFPGLF